MAKTFFFRLPVFGLQKRLNFRFWPKFIDRNNENSGQDRLRLSHSFEIASPPFSNPGYAHVPTNLNGPPTIIFKWTFNNNFNPVGPGFLSLILPTNLNRPPRMIFKWAPNFNGLPTIILIQGPGTLNLMFAKQFKRITRVKLRVFILKVANLGPHVTF